jgi:phosphoribosyl 1,2-cyclic phosphodiesterase
MSLDLCILASGSSGNCSIVRTPGGVILIDGGLGPRTIDRRLGDVNAGVRLDQVAGVCLTHLDRDHVSHNFVTWASRRHVPVFCHAGKIQQLHHIARRQCCSLNVRGFHDNIPFEPVDGLLVEPFALAHDAEGSHGFVLSMDDRRIGYATDLGRVPVGLVERLSDAGGLDVLAIECNYCPQLQLASSRPPFLKQRIMGGNGHLSNLQAFAMVRQVLDRHQRNGHELPASIVLLHRSQQCNCPDRVRELFHRDARIRQRLVLAEQKSSTGWLRRRSGIAPARQMCFAWG